MDRREYLAICYIEELAEVVKEAAKCLRFTFDHRHVDYNESNQEKLEHELDDLEGIRVMLAREGIVLKSDPNRIRDKILRTEELIRLSTRMGVIKDEACNH